MKVEVERGTPLILEVEAMGNLPIPICSGYAINVRGDNNIGQQTKRRRWMTTTLHYSFVGSVGSMFSESEWTMTRMGICTSLASITKSTM